MPQNTLRLFNTKLAEDLKQMNVGQLWDFLQANEARVKQFQNGENYPKTGVLWAYPYGQTRYREHFLSETEEEFCAVIYTLILDFCLGEEVVELGYWGRSGFLDSPASCRVKTSADIMPPVEEGSQVCHYTIDFRLLDVCLIENIISAIENKPAAAADETSTDTAADLAKIKAIKEFCINNEGYNAIYIYHYY